MSRLVQPLYNIRHSYCFNRSMVFGVTVTDIVSFILRYRKDKVVAKWTVDELEYQVLDAISNDCLCVDTIAGNIVGVVLGKKTSESSIHVVLVLVTQRGCLKRFAEWYSTHYSGWSLSAERGGESINYNTVKLIQKLKHYG